MIGLECLHTTAEISERSDVIRAFPKRSKSSCNFARSVKTIKKKSLFFFGRHARGFRYVLDGELTAFVLR